MFDERGIVVVTTAAAAPPAPLSDPASRSASSWQARIAAYKSRHIPDDDPRIVESRAALAYWHIHKVIAAETGRLSTPGADRLVVMLREAARH